MMYNWQKTEWPRFGVEVAELGPELEAFASAHAGVEAAYAKIAASTDEADGLVREALSSGGIEGERLDGGVIQSSVLRLMGLPPAPGPRVPHDVRAEGAALLVMDVARDRLEAVTPDLLMRWHRDLMAPLPSAGRFRTHTDAMRIVRRDAFGAYEVLFEAPPSGRVPEEMDAFSRAWASSSWTGERLSDAALRAALFHPYFESIHPFEDGNGRLGRALVAKELSASFSAPIVVPLSPLIASRRKAYYAALRESSLSLAWTPWAKFFIPLLTEAMKAYGAEADFVLKKRAFLGHWEGRLPARPFGVLRRLFADGADGVARGLSVQKYRRMTGVSKPTATRDLVALVSAGVLVQEGQGRATRYAVRLQAPRSVREPRPEGPARSPNGRPNMV